VLLSGGLDSAAMLYFFATKDVRPRCLFVAYGQPAEEQERHAAMSVAEHFHVPLTTISVRGGSRKSVGEIPGRNLFLLGFAFTELKAPSGVIAIGVHAGTDYADCSAQFVETMQQCADHYFHGAIQVLAPFLTWTKRDIWSYSQANIPVSLTYSCESGNGVPCGDCLSCRDREALDACT
jgi:7-cyano-7-deazaguanine synthase